jgi:hypothetical protein
VAAKEQEPNRKKQKTAIDHQVSEVLHKRDQIVAADLKSIHVPSVESNVPHPAVFCNVTDRFTVKDGCFTFMGRTKLGELMTTLGSPIHSSVNLLGTKYFGKSHIIAAYVAKRMQDYFASKEGSRPIIFLSKCGDFAKAPAKYLQCAMMLGFGSDEATIREIAGLQIDTASLLSWLDNRQFDVVADQVNDIDANEEISIVDLTHRSVANDVLYALDVIVTVQKCFRLKGFSANNEIMRSFYNTERSDQDIEFNGGFSEICLAVIVIRCCLPVR